MKGYSPLPYGQKIQQVKYVKKGGGCKKKKKKDDEVQT